MTEQFPPPEGGGVPFPPPQVPGPGDQGYGQPPGAVPPGYGQPPGYEQGGPAPAGAWQQGAWQQGMWQPENAKGRRTRTIVIAVVAGVIAVLGVLGVVGKQLLSGTAKGSVVLPAKLLGLSRLTTSEAKSAAGAVGTRVSTAAGNKIKHVVAGVYGSPTSAWLVVAGGGICGTCAPKSPSAVVQGMQRAGITDARSFSGGQNGGILVCGSQANLYLCDWIDQKTAGDVVFAGGAANGLGDAADKANQIRVAVEH